MGFSDSLCSRPWLPFSQLCTRPLISLFTVSGVVNAGMAKRMQCDHRIDIVWSAVRTAVDVMAFKIRFPFLGLERSWLATTLASAFGTSQDVSSDRCGAMVDGSLGAISGPSVRGVDCALAHNIAWKFVKFIYAVFKSRLREVLASNQVKNDLLDARADRSDLNLVVSVVEPFAIKAILAVFLKEQKDGSVILHVFEDLVIIVMPGISPLSSLTVVLVAAVRQEPVMVAVFVPVGVRHDDHRIFDIAVTYAFDVVAAKDPLDVVATVKPTSDVLMPRHVLPPVALPMAVSRTAGCIRVKETR